MNIPRVLYNAFVTLYSVLKRVAEKVRQRRKVFLSPNFTLFLSKNDFGNVSEIFESFSEGFILNY